MSKTDMQLKRDIEEELRWDRKINAAQVGVSVDGGSVSLVGTVDTYAEKWAAEDATKRVSGVRTVAADLVVKLLTDHVRTDTDIAAATLNALKWDVSVPDTVKATVRNGYVTLEGTVRWNYQRDSAELAIRNLTGVVAVNNSIMLRPQPEASQVKESIQAALVRQAATDGRSIQVETAGSKVTLTGTASSWQSIEDASNAAWSAPGVTAVDDKLVMSMTS